MSLEPACCVETYDDLAAVNAAKAEAELHEKPVRIAIKAVEDHVASLSAQLLVARVERDRAVADLVACKRDLDELRDRDGDAIDEAERGRAEAEERAKGITIVLERNARAAAMDANSIAALRAEVARLRSTIAALEQGSELYRHVERGAHYRAYTVARLEAAKAVTEGTCLMIYRGVDSNLVWARPMAEFHDGRFEHVKEDPQ